VFFLGAKESAYNQGFKEFSKVCDSNNIIVSKLSYGEVLNYFNNETIMRSTSDEFGLTGFITVMSDSVGMTDDFFSGEGFFLFEANDCGYKLLLREKDSEKYWFEGSE